MSFQIPLKHPSPGRECLWINGLLLQAHFFNLLIFLQRIVSFALQAIRPFAILILGLSARPLAGIHSRNWNYNEKWRENLFKENFYVVTTDLLHKRNIFSTVYSLLETFHMYLQSGEKQFVFILFCFTTETKDFSFVLWGEKCIKNEFTQCF